MFRKASIVAFVVLAVTAIVTAQVAQPEMGAKAITFTVLLPQADATVAVDGKEVKGEGEKRTLTVPLAANKSELQVVAAWEPNHHTHITRPRKVVWKEGEIVVDFRQASDIEKDDIVVIFVPTPQEFVQAMCKLAKVGKDDVVYDLGCGDGRMVITAVKDFGAKRGVGIELNLDLVQQCRQSAKDAEIANKVDFRVGNVLKVNDLSEANVVLLYMGDDINQQLKPILQKTLQPGSRVVSHRFLMGNDWSPNQSEHVKATMGEFQGYEEDIHLWLIKDPKK
jgi:uncharacterized protein (TIGR03000 family)